MAWYLDIILGFAVSTAFFLGGILYTWSRDEVDNLFKGLEKYKHKEKILVISAILSGILFAVLFGTAWKEIASLLMFILMLTLGSISLAGNTKIVALEYSAASMLLFFVGFLATYLLRI